MSNYNDLFSGYVPPILRETKLKVYEYKIVDFPRSFVLSDNLRMLLHDEQKSPCDYAKCDYWYDVQNFPSPPSKLISCSNTLTRTYNPFENGDLFKKFTKLGNRDKVNEAAIKSFIDKYGLLTHIIVEDNHINQEYPMESIKKDNDKNSINIDKTLRNIGKLNLTDNQKLLFTNDKIKTLKDVTEILENNVSNKFENAKKAQELLSAFKKSIIPKEKKQLYFSDENELRELHEIYRYLSRNNGHWNVISQGYSDSSISKYENESTDLYQIYRLLDKNNWDEIIEKYPNSAISKYELKNFEDLLALLSNVKNPDRGYPGYPIKAIHKHAREAYITLKLYESLIKKESSRIRDLLLSYVKFQDFSAIFEHLVVNDSLILRWRLDYPFFDKLVSGNVIGNVYAPDEHEASYLMQMETPEDYYNDNWNEEDVQYWWTWDQKYTKEFWMKCFELAQRDFLHECASELIAAITNEHIQSSPGLSIRPQSLSPNYTFHNVWRSSSLLNALWIQFYLEITHQLESEKKINCSICGKVIENPRGKQRFCNNKEVRSGCRQTHYLRLKRNVLRLWKEGKTVEEIQDLMLDEDISMDRIKRWTSALSKDQSPIPLDENAENYLNNKSRG